MEHEEPSRNLLDRPFLRSSRSVSIVIGTFAVLVILAIWGGLYAKSTSERRDAEEAAIRANQNRVMAFEQYVVRTLENADMALIDLQLDYGTRVGTPARPARIDGLVFRSGSIKAVSVADENGYLLSSSVGPLRPFFNVADRDSFKAHSGHDTGRPYVSVPTYSKLLGRWVINITRRINKPDGSFGGVAGVAIYPENLVDFYGDAKVSTLDLMSVIGEDGITRARRRGNVTTIGEDLNGLPVMAFHRGHPNGDYEGPGGLDGIRRFFSHRTIKNYPLFVTVGVAREEVLGPTRRRERYYIGAAMAMTVFVIAFCWLLASYIDRRHRTAAELAGAIEGLREAQRIANIGDWEYDLVTGRIAWSDNLFAMYGRDPALGAPSFPELLDYYDDQGRAAVQRAIRMAIKTGQPQEHEQNVYLRDGRVTYHQALAVPTRGPSGEVVRLHGTAQDVSSRKLVETLEARLAHLSRIDAMNTMAATLAHELNQPLTAAANYMAGTRRILEKLKPDQSDILGEGVNGAEKQLLLAGNIIRRVRDMIAARSAKAEPSSLAEIINDALSLVSMTSRFPDTAVKLDLDPHADLVSADPVQIQQVLINLIRNANDAMENEPVRELTIATSYHSVDEVKLCVTDTGKGVSPDVADLFSTFSTSKENGLGIGLSISRTIVEAHHGQIWVEKTDTDGTAICFTLPVARP